MQIGVLGSFEVLTDDSAFANVPGARLRGLLIAIALKPGHVVPKATVVDWIWGEHPPADATNAFSTAILVIAELVMRPPSAPPLTRPRHAPATARMPMPGVPDR